MAEAAKEPTAEDLAKLELVEAEPVYASNFHLQGTGNDFQIMFQRPRAMMDGLKISNVAKLEVVASIAMSPQAFKDLSVLMADTLQKYEKEFGEIQTSYTRGLKKQKP